jgi:hypothetical protein
MVGLDTAEARREWRQTHAKPVADTFHKWLIAQRQLVPNGSATAKAIEYSLRRWEALPSSTLRVQKSPILTVFEDRGLYFSRG